MKKAKQPFNRFSRGGRHHQKYKVAQRSVEWYSVHTNSVAFRGMAQRMSNGTAYTQMV